MPQLTVRNQTYSIQAILLDKDGTIMDFIFTWGNWSKHMLARFSVQLEERDLGPLNMDVSKLWGTISTPDGVVCDYNRNGPLAMGTTDELLTILAWQGYQLGLSWAEAKLVVHDCRAYADEQLDRSRAVELLPDVLPFLEQCHRKGIMLAVVTADETAQATKQLEWLGISQYFSACIGTDQVERGKPFPDMVELACQQLDVPCSQVVVIGDTNGDMRMAKSAGATVAVGIAGSNLHEAAQQLPHADIIISSYQELAVIEGGD